MRERLVPVGAGRLAVAAVALILFAVWVLLLAAVILAPCGDVLCFGDAVWVVPVAAALAVWVVWLYASRRTAAPLYLVSAWLGAGAAATILTSPAGRLDPIVLLSTVYQLVAVAALVDLRHQQRSAVGTGVGLILVGGWVLVTGGGVTIDAVAPIVAGVLPLAAWRLSRAPATVTDAPADDSAAGA